jgi:hypothetical protein
MPAPGCLIQKEHVMTDRTTKFLLAVIALGLWANLAVSLFRPMAAVAQSYELSSIRSDVADLALIARGTCTNSKIC